MRRLRIGQTVALELEEDAGSLGGLGEESGSVACVVAALAGHVATLVRTVQIRRTTVERLRAGTPGFLLFSHDGRPVALRGALRAPAPDAAELDFVVIDGVQLPERRGQTRFRFQAAARLVPRDGGSPLHAVTGDLSLGGALLHLDQAPPVGEFGLEISLGDGGEPLRLGAVTVRTVTGGAGVRFTAVEDGDRARLGRLLGSES
jgi:hypothetical protein